MITSFVPIFMAGSEDTDCGVESLAIIPIFVSIFAPILDWDWIQIWNWFNVGVRFENGSIIYEVITFPIVLIAICNFCAYISLILFAKLLAIEKFWQRFWLVGAVLVTLINFVPGLFFFSSYAWYVIALIGVLMIISLYIPFRMMRKSED